jgi:hypothetical protein
VPKRLPVVKVGSAGLLRDLTAVQGRVQPGFIDDFLFMLVAAFVVVIQQQIVALLLRGS